MRPGRLGRQVAYDVLDLVTGHRGLRRRLNGQAMRFPARWARYYPREYQPDTYQFLLTHCHEHTTVIDAGAHLGVFSVVMARLVGPRGVVLAFEPTPDTREALLQILTLNGVDSIVEVRAEALAERDGTADLHGLGVSVGVANSLVTIANASPLVTVSTKALDSLVEPTSPVSCIKIDVEGAELRVLKGARQTIEAWRPAIALDIHPEAISRGGDTLQELWDVIVGFGYMVRRSSAIISQDDFLALSSPTDVQLTHK